MKDALNILIEIFKPNGIDWMHFNEDCKDNPYTFHHIVEKRNGGKKVITNGAILTKDAHFILNVLDETEPEMYQDLNWLFKELNHTMLPPTENYYEEVNGILMRKPKVLKLVRNK